MIAKKYLEYAVLKRYTKPFSNKRPDWNAVYVRSGNSYLHEAKKLQVAMIHRKNGCNIITEAQASDKSIVDLVCLTCDEEVEIINTHGDPVEYKKKGRTVVFVENGKNMGSEEKDVSK